MACLYATTDLFFSSRVCSLARDHGLDVTVEPTLDAVTQRLAGGEFSLVIIDLNAARGDLAAAISQWKESAPDLQVIAYGPHVDQALLSSAQQAGCDQVLPRSQFDQQIVALLQQHTRGTE